MKRTTIKEKLLKKGFKEKLQPDGTYDLNPYVYEAVYFLLNQQNVALFNDMKAGMHYVSGYGHKQYKEGVNHCLNFIQTSNDQVCAELDKIEELKSNGNN